MIWTIGDLHGKINSYQKLLARIHKQDLNAITFQVGDVAVGFEGVTPPLVGESDFWIAGNHDNPDLCRTQKGCLGDFGVVTLEGQKVFYMRGADSIDKEDRTEGVSWWRNEELDYAELSAAVQLYIDEKPDIVISHDGPQEIVQTMFPGVRERSRTRQALDAMLTSNHVPDSCASMN